MLDELTVLAAVTAVWVLADTLERIVVDVKTSSSVQTWIAVAWTRARSSNKVRNLKKSEHKHVIETSLNGSDAIE